MKVKGRHLYTATYMNMTSSGLQCEVAYWPAMTLGRAAQVAAAHCPNEQTLDPAVCSYNRPNYASVLFVVRWVCVRRCVCADFLFVGLVGLFFSIFFLYLYIVLFCGLCMSGMIYCNNNWLSGVDDDAVVTAAVSDCNPGSRNDWDPWRADGPSEWIWNGRPRTHGK